MFARAIRSRHTGWKYDDRVARLRGMWILEQRNFHGLVRSLPLQISCGTGHHGSVVFALKKEIAREYQWSWSATVYIQYRAFDVSFKASVDPVGCKTWRGKMKNHGGMINFDRKRENVDRELSTSARWELILITEAPMFELDTIAKG